MTHSRPYLEALNAEYTALIEAQWQRMLAENEQERLEAIKAELNTLDTTSAAHRTQEQQIENIHRQLADIHREVEALPDASR